MAVTLLDSVAIVAYLDASNIFHTSADRAITEAAAQGRLIASIISYAELLTGSKLGHHDQMVVRGFFDELVATLVPVDRDVAERAANLRGARRSLRLPDALIIATGDLQADQIIGADRAWQKVRGLSCEVRLLDAAAR